MSEAIKKYNIKPEQAKSKTVGDICHSVLFRDVPRTKIKMDSPQWNDDKCWHCQEFDRLKAEPDCLVWCERCYILQFKKFDGTFIQHKGIPALKQLTKDINEHKYIEVPLKKADTRYIEE